MINRQTIAGIVAFATVLAASNAQSIINRDEYTEETTQTCAIQADGLITATTPDGNIIVEAWDGDDVSLLIRKRVRTRLGASSAQAQFAKMKIDITETDSAVTIVGDVPNFTVGYGYSIDYEMRVPAGVSLELRTSDGGVHIQGVYGKVYARSSDGDISVEDVGVAELRTSDGDIKADIVGGDLSAITSDGEIHVSNVDGNANIRSSDGNINCREVTGLVIVQLSDGDARMESIHGGVNARSSDGVLIVRDASGPIQLKTSDGDIELSLAHPVPMSRVACTTSDGNIRLNLNESAAFTVEARTSDGRVNVDLPGKLHREKNGKRVEGHINGGGPAVTLRSSDGSITIEAA